MKRTAPQLSVPRLDADPPALEGVAFDPLATISVEPPPLSFFANHQAPLADTDPYNDQDVAPPEVSPQCMETLEGLGIDFQHAQLPFTKKRGDDFTCGAPQVVIYEGGPESIRYNSRPMVTCRMAMALARFEALAQELASEYLHAPIAQVVQLGTYACRRTERGGPVSEHSYANAIDIQGFRLQDHTFISVGRHFRPKTKLKNLTPEGRFLKELAYRLYHEDVFSGVLTPHFDARHLDHFHLDLARYRVNGTRD